MASRDRRVRRLASIAPGLAVDALGGEKILACHERAMEQGQDGYIDPISGLFVITAACHIDRGTCCESQCRHCPYDERGNLRAPAVEPD